MSGQIGRGRCEKGKRKEESPLWKVATSEASPLQSSDSRPLFYPKKVHCPTCLGACQAARPVQHATRPL
jgi:hypothetical protein